MENQLNSLNELARSSNPQGTSAKKDYSFNEYVKNQNFMSPYQEETSFKC
jgi:hypothetical protein